MAFDRPDRVSDLYHAALERAPEHRSAFLREACNGDEELREEVESLLRYESDSTQFLERPAGGVAVTETGTISMIDRQLGPYTIVGPLGAGGMGEVYRARDSKLGRDVAIKILPAHFTADSERRGRFAREARTLATLNHPHIGSIYGLEESDGMTALVLELVEGPTLADRVERGPLPVPDALAIARQIAEALEAAHGKGIIHRDLKPANIVLTGEASGDLRAKVLDFGLAKAMTRDSAAVQPKETFSSFDGTAEGRVLGTPAYMSPEQARGQTVDNRTDVWAFGCVLYEMLTGRPPFEGDTMSDTFVSILEREPDWVALPAATPASIRRLLERCLRKDARKRLHDIADAILDIDDATTMPRRSSPSSPPTAGGSPMSRTDPAATKCTYEPSRDETVHQVSRDGGWTPRWRRDGKELFFLSPASKMMAVSIDPTKGTALGAPRELFQTDLRPDYQHRPFDVTRDGERFLVPTIRPGDDFRVVLNWRTLLPW